jgi:hypothetical protein
LVNGIKIMFTFLKWIVLGYVAWMSVSILLTLLVVTAHA